MHPVLLAIALLPVVIPCVVGPSGSANVCKEVARPEESEKASIPGVTIGTQGAGTASATRAPWVESNGSRFLRKPGGKYIYELPKGKAPLAAAEAFVYQVDARLRIAPEDSTRLDGMLAFLKKIPDLPGLRQSVNIAVIDTGSKTIPEVVNMMVRRNLLCRVVSAPDPSVDLNVRIGSAEFPEAEAANPVAVADKARRMLTDRKRLLRIYGTETVIARLYTSDNAARIHLLNYSSSTIAGVRVRVRGLYQDIRLSAFGFEGAKPEDVVVSGDATEFTVPEMSAYAVVDLKKTK
jgi:hypothetical protein